MRLRCTECGKSVSTEVPDETIVRAALKCPECIEAQDVPRERERDEAHAAIRVLKAAGQKFAEVDHVDEDGNVTPAYNAAYRDWYQVLSDNAPAIRRASGET